MDGQISHRVTRSRKDIQRTACSGAPGDGGWQVPSLGKGLIDGGQTVY